MNTEDIIRAAKAELEAEKFRSAVNAEKASLRSREHRSLWQAIKDILPFTIERKKRDRHQSR